MATRVPVKRCTPRRTLPYVPVDEIGANPKGNIHKGRTFTNDFPEGVVPDYSNLLRRELLPEFIIGVRKLSFVILSLRNGRGVTMTINSHCYMYK